jgi:hypothetical protein
MNKLLLSVILSSIACATPLLLVAEQEISPSLASAPTPPLTQAIVVAEIALRIRTLPEEWGGTELSTIPKGGTFTVYTCMDVDGTEWAFGGHTDGAGTNWVGYVAARYLDGGCE